MPQEKELHLFMPIGDDEIQVESHDRRINLQVMKLKKDEPASTVILYDDDYPAFLRAAVKMKNISISFHTTEGKKEPTEAQKKARSENGRKAYENNNLRNTNPV